MFNDRVLEDARTQEALNMILLIMREYDLAGAVAVVNEHEMGFGYQVYTTWNIVVEDDTVQAYAGKHSCEKPMAMLRHIIEASSRPGDVVLDPMAGSFSTLDAARQCGRKGIGIEQNRHWWQKGQQRLSQETLFTRSATPLKAPITAQLPLLTRRH